MQVMDFLGSAAFSKAVQALDIKTGMLVCLKIVKVRCWPLSSAQLHVCDVCTLDCPGDCRLLSFLVALQHMYQHHGHHACCLISIWVLQNNKDYFDQSLDEIKLLRFVNEADPADEHNLLRLYDYFYYKVPTSSSSCSCHCFAASTAAHAGLVAFWNLPSEAVLQWQHRSGNPDIVVHACQEHLFLVCELLRANLYEFQKYNRSHGDEPYFTVSRVQRIARQVRTPSLDCNVCLQAAPDMCCSCAVLAV